MGGCFSRLASMQSKATEFTDLNRRTRITAPNAQRPSFSRRSVNGLWNLLRGFAAEPFGNHNDRSVCYTAALARWLTGIPLTKCRVTVKREPRDVVLNDKWSRTSGQKPGYCILHGARDEIDAFLWVIT